CTRPLAVRAEADSVEFSTSTEIGTLVTFPAASATLTTKVCQPFGDPVVSTVNEKLEPSELPSGESFCERVAGPHAPAASKLVPLMLNTPETMLPLAGVATETTGPSVSRALAALLKVKTSEAVLWLPLASVARTVRV